MGANAYENLGFVYVPLFRIATPHLVLYNISCPPGHLSFFDLTELDLPDPNCFEPNSGQCR